MENNKGSSSETDWKSRLSDLQYHVLREKGTEQPHSGKYNQHFESGSYHCAACDAKLFESDAKFKSSCGWPSFDDAVDGAVEYKKDTSFGMVRTEVVCASCGGHLGHVFNDGPTDTGERFCVNSVSIQFEKS